MNKHRAYIGWKAGTEQYQPDQLLEQAILADKVGFSYLDVSDHFQPWSEQGSCAFSWSWLGAASVQTERIILGTGLTCPIIRYHPSIIAQAAATMGYLSKGRFFLSVGTGEALNEYAATGLWPGYVVRTAMLKEAIEIIRHLWTGNEVSFNGEYYVTKKAKLFTISKQPIPIYISSLVPNSAYFAGVNGDGLLTVGGQKKTIYQEILTNFSQGAKEAGKNPDIMPKLIELNVAFTNDSTNAIAEMKKYWAGTFIPAIFDQKIYTPKMSAMNGESVGSDTIREKMCISDKPSDHISYLMDYINLGFTHIFVHSAGPDQLGFIQHFSQQILPHVPGYA